VYRFLENLTAHADFRSEAQILDLRIRLFGRGLVHKVEYDRRSPKPLSTVVKRPNGVGFGKLAHECLNERIWHFVSIALLYPRGLEPGFLLVRQG